MYGLEMSYSQNLYPRLAVDSIILNDHNEILLARRSQWPYVGCWDFPGGHIYVNETIAECQKREVMEELGVEAEPGKLFHVYADKGQSPKFMDVAVFYFAKINSTDFVKNIEMDDFAFFPLNKLPEKIVYHHDRALTDLRKYLNL